MVVNDSILDQQILIVSDLFLNELLLASTDQQITKS